MRKVNTPDVIKEVSSRMGCYKKDCAELLEHFADIIVENVQAGRAVSHKDIGMFYPFISARCQLKIKFRPAKKVALKVAGNSNVSENNNIG